MAGLALPLDVALADVDVLWEPRVALASLSGRKVIALSGSQKTNVESISAVPERLRE